MPIPVLIPSAKTTTWEWPNAVYLHIPFCQQRCHYCDFATGLGTAALIEEYVQVLCHDIATIPTADQVIQTVFFGGGTPSLLSVAQLEQIMTALRIRLTIAHDAEISLEANPGTTTREQLAGFRDLGVNRISLGVQAFQPHLLAVCGRIHGVAEVYETIDHLQQVGIPNFNLDLIFGLPQQTLDDWQASLAAVLEIAPPHVSVYDLTIEAGTRFGRLYQPGSQPLPPESETVEMYLMARQLLLAAGYEHYEISNFAQPGSQCLHNRVYWENRSYYGLGMGATGFVQGIRRENPRTIHEYFQQVRYGGIPDLASEPIEDRWLNTLMLGLRLVEGLDLAYLRQTFGVARVEGALQTLAPYQAQGWVTWQEDRLRLLPPQGWLFANTVLVALWD